MASNQFDSAVRLLYVTDNGTFFASDSVTIGKEFDVVANVEIGRKLMEQVEDHKVTVSIVNISKSQVVANRDVTQQLQKSELPFNAELRINFPGNWQADDGDVLEAVASYKVTTGLFDDYSIGRSLPIVATDG